MRRMIALSMLAVLGACTPSEKSLEEAVPAASARPLPTSLEEAVDSPFRSTDNQQRDKYRRPLETLQFFGVKPDMTVVEITPGGGWYSEVLAPLLTANGKFIAAVFPAGDSEYRKNMLARYDSWIEANPELKVHKTVFGPPNELNIAEAGTADMVVTFRNVHGWVNAGVTDETFQAFYQALKPGGVLGLVAHRAAEQGEDNPRSGYVKESAVIAMAQKAGFVLDGKSEINANPKDTRDHEHGVWTLPPGLRKGEVDRDKYLAIGESDRMTLRFVKPSK